MQVANRICPRCHNANYVRYLGELSDSYKYKCINCNAYLNDEDFEKPVLNNLENNKKMNSGGLISFEDMNKIFAEMRERQEDYIVRTIEQYLDPIIETKIDEKLLVRALIDYCSTCERKMKWDEND